MVLEARSVSIRLGGVLVKGKVANVPVLPLPLAPPVVAQLHAANGECWAATYSTPTRNYAERFDAQAD